MLLLGKTRIHLNPNCVLCPVKYKTQLLLRTSSYFSTEASTTTTVNKKWSPTQFAVAKLGTHDLQAPVLENQYTGNAFMRRYLKRHLPQEIHPEIESDLTQFGHRVSTDIHRLMLECEKMPPVLYQSAWGTGQTELVTSSAWKGQRWVSVKEGLISIGYNRKKYGPSARLYQHAKLYLYNPSSGSYGCPLAMTDGAAKSIEALGLLDDLRFSKVYRKLISNDPSKFWTSGQWMTEKGGGSDVAGGTETVAVPDEGSSEQYRLHGFKWFSSATDANMALTLARIADADGNVVQGTEGLSLFYLPVRENNGPVHEHINLIRLKDKVGTRPLPTAEILLNGALAIKISKDGRGIASIAHMLQITRLHNAVASAGYLWRLLSLARDYAQRRRAFGWKIIDWPLHAVTLARLDVWVKASMVLAFENARLLGLIETGEASDEQKLLFRILSPLAKLYNAKIGLMFASDGLEALGGQAVMEDTGIGYLYRDAPIAAIWEGTTSVLSLDVLRSIIKSNGETMFAFRSNLTTKLQPHLTHPQFGPLATQFLTQLDEMIHLAQQEPTLLEIGARDFAFSLANLYVAGLLIEHAASVEGQFGGPNLDQLTALRFCSGSDMVPFLTNMALGQYGHEWRDRNVELVMEGYNTTN